MPKNPILQIVTDTGNITQIEIGLIKDISVVEIGGATNFRTIEDCKGYLEHIRNYINDDHEENP